MSRRECNFGGCNDSVIHLADGRSMGWFCIFTSIESDNNQLNVGKCTNAMDPSWVLVATDNLFGCVFYWWCFSLSNTMVNHHWTTIWVEYFWSFFQASNKQMQAYEWGCKAKKLVQGKVVLFFWHSVFRYSLGGFASRWNRGNKHHLSLLIQANMEQNDQHGT